MEDDKIDFTAFVECLQAVSFGFIAIDGAAMFFSASDDFREKIEKIQSKFKNK